MPPFKMHLFVCTHARDLKDPRGSCAARGSEKIRDFFKEELKKRGLSKGIRANASGCLDHCAQGPTVVIYPEGIWYRVQNFEDAQEIVEEHLEKGRLVERLLIYPSDPKA